MNRALALTIGPILLAALALTGCQQSTPDTPVQSIRPIKSMTLSSKIQAVEQRRFPGLVRVANSSALSFEVAGKVLEVLVNVGDQVAAGQRLALVDNEPFQLRVSSAGADLRKARANYKNAASDYKRKRGLKKTGFISASVLDNALAQRDAAQNQVTVAKSQLGIAKRDFQNTVLEAPFSGYISRRTVEPHQEMTSGQKIFQLDGLDQIEVELMLPETIIASLKRGDAGRASFSSLKDVFVKGHISKIGTRAETANAFLVTLQLDERPQGIYPGMSAEVDLSIDRGVQAQGFLLPASAVVASVGTEPGHHFVFIYNKGSSTVEKRPVFISGGQRQMARVSSGLEEGEIVAVAGTSFLSDGMKVKLLDPQN